VLTNFDEADLRDMSHTCTVSELVERRVEQAMDAGGGGIVCSAVEVARVRKIAGPKATLVTPGVRSAGATTGDQKRVATPAQAIAAGADYVVIGRQVTRTADPRGEFQKILEEVSGVARPA
jgi:orotidine-5'-phosphate decarboxylase